VGRKLESVQVPKEYMNGCNKHVLCKGLELVKPVLEYCPSNKIELPITATLAWNNRKGTL